MNTKLGTVGYLFEGLVAAAIIVSVIMLPNWWITIVMIEFLILLGGLMIIVRVGSDDLFQHLEGLGPISWFLSFIPFVVAGFIGILLDR